MSTPELPKTIPYHIAERIRHGIIRGKYAQGSSLRETELCADFGSSRGPIRESLRLLELQGLVVHSPRRGFRVRSFTRQELEHLYRMRATLESVVIDALAEKNTTALAKSLNVVNEAMREAGKRGNIEEYFDLNVEFHQMIIDACESITLSRVLSIVNDMSLPIRYAIAAEKFSEVNDYEYHKKVSRAIERRDFELAQSLTEQHVLENIPNALDIAKAKADLPLAV